MMMMMIKTVSEASASTNEEENVMMMMIKTVSEASASTNEEEEEEEEEEGRVKQPTNKKESESVFLYRNVVERVIEK